MVCCNAVLSFFPYTHVNISTHTYMYVDILVDMYMYACMCCLVARCACLHPFIAMRVHQCQRVVAAFVCQVAFDRLIAEFL